MDPALPREPADAGRGTALPLYSNDSGSVGWWGMVVLLISDAAVIASFVFAYLFLWTARPGCLAARRIADSRAFWNQP